MWFLLYRHDRRHFFVLCIPLVKEHRRYYLFLIRPRPIGDSGIMDHSPVVFECVRSSSVFYFQLLPLVPIGE